MSFSFDSTDPTIRLALKHVRLQGLTPMSVLINLIASMICTIIVKPPIQKISQFYITPLSPQPFMAGVYWIALYILLVGYCLLLFIARKDETKKTIAYGVGYRLVIVQWLFAANTVSFTFKWFIPSLIFTSLSLIGLIWIHITLLLHPPHNTRPLDYLFIHFPMRLLLAVTFLLDLPQVLFLVLGWYTTADSVHVEPGLMKYGWRAVAFVVSFNVVGLVEVGLNQDFPWALAGLWLLLSQLVKSGKPAPVFGTLIAFTVLYPVVFVIAVLAWRAYKNKQRGEIRLPDDEEAEAEAARARLQGANDSQPS